MDEAFLALQAMVADLLAFDDELLDDEAGVRSMITAYEIDTPIELDITRALDGQLRIGTVPPLYRVETSILPSFHAIRIRAELDEAVDA